jgi:hypothetical protein
VRLGAESLTLGMRGIMQNALYLDGVRVPPSRLLGEAGKGMRIVEEVLSHGRLAMAAIAVGATQRCAQLILRHASRRRIETGLQVDNPQLAARISELLHRAALDRELVAHCAAACDADAPVVPEIAMLVKVRATDSALAAADLLVQVLGGRGYMETNLAPQILRDARMFTIGEGANESLIGAVGRSVRLTDAVPAFLAAYRPAGDLAARLRGCAAELERHAVLGPYRGSDVQVWRDATLGRLAALALGVAAAEALTERGLAPQETLAWARHRFERACRDAERAPDEAAAFLDADRIRATVAGYREAIGDLEPLAPDVDWTLDPLLRREPEGPAGVDAHERRTDAALSPPTR